MKKMLVLICGLMFSLMVATSAYCKTYTISPKTKPCNHVTSTSAYYTKYTKNYWTIRSYLDKLSKKGGTLVLKKGTYKISNTLFIGSNTKLVLSDGVVIKKINKSGTKVMPAVSSLFQTISYSKSRKKSNIGKHNGGKNIQIIGKGKATIDLGKLTMKTPVIGIVMGHNKNVTIENVIFKNNGYGHMLEIDAGYNIKIKNCTFSGYKKTSKHNKEAINLDTPDKNRDGFNAPWSKLDKTPNENIEITGCTFKNLETGVGTHRYTGDVYQKNVKITNCTFEKIETAIRVLNWKDFEISHNTLKNINPNSKYPYAMFIAGAYGINVSYNSFINCGTSGSGRYGKQLLQFWCGAGYDANQTLYAPTKSSITAAQAALFKTNTASSCGIIRTYNCPEDIDFNSSQDNSYI